MTLGPGRGIETCTTIICFGAHSDLTKRFEYLASHPSWLDAVKSPFNLFLIVLEELFLVLDNKVWDLSDLFRTMETVSEYSQSSTHLESLELLRIYSSKQERGIQRAYSTSLDSITCPNILHI